MRIRAAIDGNQPEIVEGLREAGRSVVPLHQIGGGVPDLIVGFQGVNYLIEVKVPGRRKKLTPDQEEFHKKWKGSLAVVETLTEALEATKVK